jgi:hypothetical protein
MTQRLRYDLTGQVLRHVPKVRQATADWVLEDLLRSDTDAARILDDGTNVAVDAATQVTTAAAGPSTANPRSIAMTDTTGFVVRHDIETGDPVATFEIVSVTTGELERFVLAGVQTNAALIATAPLRGSFPSGSTVRGVELVTAALDPAVLQDEQRMQGDWPMRMTWTFPDGSEFRELVRLVRSPGGHDLNVDRALADILLLFPDASTRMLYNGHDTLPGHVRVTVRNMRADALALDIDFENWLTGEQGHWALVWRTLWHLAELGNAPGGDQRNDPRQWATYCKDEYDKRWNSLTIGEAGPEVLEIDPVSDTASSSNSTEYRRILTEL